MKLRIFIGSSSEGLRIANSLQTNLDDAAEVTVWNQDVFRPSEFILESLLKQLDHADLGVFVFHPDDVVRMRGAEHVAARDNVIFEFGLFVGHLGRNKSIIVAPRDEDLRLPSDLLGVNVLTYRSERIDGNCDAALGPASAKLRELLEGVQPNNVPPELGLPMMERRNLLTRQQRDILSAVEERGRFSISDISKLFPAIALPELHYRLEQLRLLMFIKVQDAPQDGDTTRSYTLSEGYKYELRRNVRPLPTTG
jgi:hypothetical protein